MYTYTVSDLATALGLSPGALHFFEREGLLDTEKNHSGHRVYNTVEIFRLLSYTKYRSMGFSMKTLVKQLDLDSKIERQAIIQRLQKHRDEASQKAKYYSRLTDAIDQHIFSAARIDDLLDSYEFVQSPAIKFCYYDECGWLSKNRHTQL